MTENYKQQFNRSDLLEQWRLFRSVLVLRARITDFRQNQQKLACRIKWNQMSTDMSRVARFKNLKLTQAAWKAFNFWAKRAVDKSRRRKKYLSFILRCLSKFRILILRESKRCFVRRRWRHMIVKLRNLPLTSAIAQASVLRFNLAVPTRIPLKSVTLAPRDIPRRAVDDSFKVELVEKKTAAVRRIQSMRRTKPHEFDDILSERFMDIFFKPNAIFKSVEHTCGPLVRITRRKYNARYNMREDENGAFLSDFASGIIAAAVWNVFGSALAVTDMRPFGQEEVTQPATPLSNNTGISVVYGDASEEIQSATLESEVWDALDQDFVDGNAFYGEKPKEKGSHPSQQESSRMEQSSIVKSPRSSLSGRERQVTAPDLAIPQKKEEEPAGFVDDEEDLGPETNMTEEQWEQAFEQKQEQFAVNRSSSSGYQESRTEDTTEIESNAASDVDRSPELEIKPRRYVRQFISDSEDEIPKKGEILVKHSDGAQAWPENVSSSDEKRVTEEAPREDRFSNRAESEHSERDEALHLERDESKHSENSGSKHSEHAKSGRAERSESKHSEHVQSEHSARSRTEPRPPLEWSSQSENNLEVIAPIEFTPHKRKVPREVVPIIQYSLPSSFAEFAEGWLDGTVRQMVNETAFHVIWRTYIGKKSKRSASPRCSLDHVV